MYGLVNKAIEQLVTTQFSEAKWKQIADKAEVDHSFVMMKSYPDQVTFDLVAAAAEILETPANQILESFGEHWIEFTVDEGYGKTMSLYGSSVLEFLQNMDSLHAQIRLTYPELRPPVISCEVTVDNQLLVNYKSHRKGLAPMLVGLVRGLGNRFSTPVSVEYIASENDLHTSEKFLVTFIQ